MNRRNLISLGFGLLSLLSGYCLSEAAGFPPEEKPKLCDDTCEKELENVAANHVAMVPSGQIFDSSLEKDQPYIFRVGSGQLAFPKGLTSAPGRPRVAPASPVIFDVSLEYVPGLEDEE